MERFDPNADSDTFQATGNSSCEIWLDAFF